MELHVRITNLLNKTNMEISNEILVKLGVNPETNDKVMECQTKVKPIPKYNAQTGMWELKIDGTRIMLDY